MRKRLNQASANHATVSREFDSRCRTSDTTEPAVGQFGLFFSAGHLEGSALSRTTNQIPIKPIACPQKQPGLRVVQLQCVGQSANQPRRRYAPVSRVSRFKAINVVFGTQNSIR